MAVLGQLNICIHAVSAVRSHYTVITLNSHRLESSIKNIEWEFLGKVKTEYFLESWINTSKKSHTERQTKKYTLYVSPLQYLSTSISHFSNPKTVDNKQSQRKQKNYYKIIKGNLIQFLIEFTMYSVKRSSILDSSNH